MKRVSKRVALIRNSDYRKILTVSILITLSLFVAYLLNYPFTITGGIVTEFDSSSGVGSSGDVTTLSWSHMIGSGNNRILVVGVGYDVGTATNVNNVTFGGQNFTRLAGDFDVSTGAEMWYLLNPSVGTDTITVDLATADGTAAGAQSYFNVDQTTPFTNYTTSAGTSSAASTTVSSSTDELVIDVIVKRFISEPANVDASQEEIYNVQSSGATTDVIAAASNETGAASVSMDWSWSTTRRWAIIAASLNPGADITINIDYPQSTVYNFSVSKLNYTLANFTAPLSACWYTLNGGITNTTITCNENITGINSTEGSNTWSIYANDTNGTTDFASVSFTQDVLDLNIIYPQNIVYGFSVGQLNYSLTNITAPTDSCWYSTDGGITNSSIDQTCSNFSGLTSVEGSNTWTVYANITEGSQDSKQITFVQDTTPPSFEFFSPTPINNTKTGDSEAEINLTISESSIGELKFNWNGTNSTFYDDSLVLMYNFDNNLLLGENGTHIVDFSNYSNDGICSGTSCPAFVGEGKYGGAASFDGSNDDIDMSFDESYNISGNITLAVWVNMSSFPNNEIGIISRMDIDDPIPINTISYDLIYHSSLNGFRFETINPSDTLVQALGTTTALLNEWYYVVGRYNGTHNCIFVNSIQETCTAQSGGIRTNGENITLGVHFNNGFRFSGIMDEVRIWNSSLSNEEIQEQYRSNLRKYNLGSWELYINKSPLSDGSYTYYATATDPSNGGNSSEIRYLTIETTIPQINFSAPTKNSNINIRQDYVEINVTASDPLGFDTVTINLYDSTNNLIRANTSSTSPFFINYTGLNDGVYHYNATVIDAASNSNQTETRNINLDTIIQTQLNSPTPPNNTISINNFFEINFTIIDKLLDTLIFSWNGINSTFYDDSLVLMYNFDNVSEIGETYSSLIDLSKYENNAVLSPTDNASFNSSGTYNFTVPAGVTQITVKVWGGGGGGGDGATQSIGGNGSGGGFIQANISVTPGENLTIMVGGNGSRGGFVGAAGYGGGGGGFSGINRSNNVLIIAGGGGGGGGGDGDTAPPPGGNGGNGGGLNGGDGDDVGGTVEGGVGGTQTSGGAGGNGDSSGAVGSFLSGGAGGNGVGAGTGGGGAGGLHGGANGGNWAGTSRSGGGGAGGGYYGGGGGGASNAAATSGGGGGGGSSYTSSLDNLTESGNGIYAGRNTDPDYMGNAGQGGLGGALNTLGNDGNDGLVVISYSLNSFNYTQGKHGKGLYFEEDTSGFFVLDDPSLDLIEELTMSAWIYPRNVTDGNHFIIEKGEPDEYEFLIRQTGNLSIEIGNNLCDGATPLQPNQWYHVAGTWNESLASNNMKLYINGILDRNCTLSYTITPDDTPLVIGDNQDTPQTFNGTIDEVRIWNRSLSDAEIQQQYRSNLRKYDTDKFELYVNNTNLNETTYTYYSIANDSIGNENSTEIRYYTVDTTNPLINYSSSITEENQNLSQNYIFVNTSVTELNLENITFRLYIDSILINSTTLISGVTSLNFTNLQDGNYSYNVTVFDKAGNSNQTAAKENIFLDVTPPTVLFTCSPSSVIIGGTVNCICSATDSGIGLNASSVSNDFSIVTTETGGFSVSGCSAKDLLNNSGFATGTYTVTTEPTTSGSGGGGSSTGYTVKKTNIITKITPEDGITLNSFEGTGVKEIIILVNKETSNARVEVLRYENKPSNVSREIGGKVYRYLEINVESLKDSLEKAIVKFEVNRSWFSDNNVSKDDLEVFKFDEEKEEWNSLGAMYDSENGEYIYAVELDSFSFFAIAEKARIPIISDIVDSITGSYETAGETVFGLIVWWLVFSIISVSIILVIVLIIYQVRKIPSEEIIQN